MTANEQVKRATELRDQAREQAESFRREAIEARAERDATARELARVLAELERERGARAEIMRDAIGFMCERDVFADTLTKTLGRARDLADRFHRMAAGYFDVDGPRADAFRAAAGAVEATFELEEKF